MNRYLLLRLATFHLYFQMHQDLNAQIGWMQKHVQFYQTRVVMVYVMLTNFATHVSSTVDVEERKYAMHRLADVTPQLEYVKHHVALEHNLNFC
jgi:hypothetical protein